jgi:hypothetical protein
MGPSSLQQRARDRKSQLEEKSWKAFPRLKSLLEYQEHFCPISHLHTLPHPRKKKKEKPRKVLGLQALCGPPPSAIHMEAWQAPRREGTKSKITSPPRKKIKNRFQPT